jgi:alpha-L-rhamnosidase
VRPTHLRVNWLDEPLAVARDEATTFSWEGCWGSGSGVRLRVLDDARVVYEALVAASEFTHTARLDLPPDRAFEWTLTDLHTDGLATSSRFRTGLDEGDWASEWVQPTERTEYAPELFAAIPIPEQLRSALFSLASVGIVHCTIAGAELEPGLRLEPGFTDLGGGAVYATRDVTELLTVVAGDTAEISCLLGRGFSDMFTPNVWRWDRAPWRGPLQLRARLVLVDANGVVSTFGTGPDWRWRRSRVSFDSYYEGETHNARPEREWHPVRVSPNPRAGIAPRRHEPVLVSRAIEPVGWATPGPSIHVADFGEVLAGNVAVVTDGIDDAVQIVYAERLDDKGRAFIVNEYIGSDRLQTDVFAADGSGRVDDEALLTYKGFRYAEITSPDRPQAVAKKLHNAVRQVGTFESSDPVLNWYDAAMRRTLQNNFHHIPTDTPTYEKNGWTGDVQFAAEAMLFQFDAGPLLASWLDAVAASQIQSGPDAGLIPVIAPSAGWGFEECAPAPEWTTAYPYVVDLLAAWYADDSIIERHLTPVARYLDFEIARLGGDGLAHGALGDYNSPGSGGVPPEDLRIAASCMLIRALRTFSSHVEPAVARRYRSVASAMTAALNRACLHIDAGEYRGRSEREFREASNVLPLAVGVTPGAVAPRVVQRIKDEIARRGGHHASGAMSLPALLHLLSSTGAVDLAYSVMSADGEPSIREWIRRGHLTLLEDWSDNPRSHSHFLHGGAASWLYRDVGGLTPSRDGWSTAVVAPRIPSALDRMDVRFSSPVGEWRTQWDDSASAGELTVSVPDGCSATVILPSSRRRVEVGHGDHVFSDVHR